MEFPGLASREEDAGSDPRPEPRRDSRRRNFSSPQRERTLPVMVETAPPSPSGRRARDLAAATPETRNRYADLLRVASIFVVVIGHWLMAVLEYEDGSFVGKTCSRSRPGPTSSRGSSRSCRSSSSSAGSPTRAHGVRRAGAACRTRPGCVRARPGCSDPPSCSSPPGPSCRCSPSSWDSHPGWREPAGEGWRQQVPPPEVERIEPELVGGQIEEPFAGEGPLVATRAAVGPARGSQAVRSRRRATGVSARSGRSRSRT